MQIIADSGASKTDWRWISAEGNITQGKSSGINAYHISSIELNDLLTHELSYSFKEPITQIHFYGAGCGSSENKAKIKSGLSQYFKTDNIEVQHDLLASARATCSHEAGISCILGTGANACVYNGNEITQEMVSLGYALGDEGSGAYIGKQLIKAYLENELPEELKLKFAQSYPEIKTSLVNQNIYQKPYPNRYLAQFFRFAIQNVSDKYIFELIRASFQAFLEKSVLKFPAHKELPIHFVGGVAYHANGLLRQVLKENNLIIGKIIEGPIAGLTLYHKTNEI
jgi:N-acetylglucosamine kinase-like BadF-type ATPase